MFFRSENSSIVLAIRSKIWLAHIISKMKRIRQATFILTINTNDEQSSHINYLNWKIDSIFYIWNLLLCFFSTMDEFATQSKYVRKILWFNNVRTEDLSWTNISILNLVFLYTNSCWKFQNKIFKIPVNADKKLKNRIYFHPCLHKKAFKTFFSLQIYGIIKKVEAWQSARSN